MLKNFFGSIWRFLPGVLRRRAVRLGQKRFSVTAGAFIFDENGRLLLLEHVFRPDSGWGGPGGFLGKAEQPEAALRRELLEEIGLALGEVELLFVRTLRRPPQVEMYFLAKPQGEPKPCSFEIKRAEWFELEGLPEELSRDQRR